MGWLFKKTKWKQKRINVGEKVETLELSYIAGKNVKWCSCYRKQHENFMLKILKIEFHMI